VCISARLPHGRAVTSARLYSPFILQSRGSVNAAAASEGHFGFQILDFGFWIGNAVFSGQSLPALPSVHCPKPVVALNASLNNPNPI
jgi:hypothetical protein